MRAATLLLSGYLLVWVPFTFVTELLSSASSITMRGPGAIVELGLHGAVAAFSVAASRMLTGGSPAATAAASIAVVADGIVAIQSLYWTVLPRYTAPGTRLPLTVFWLAVSIAGLCLVRWSRPTRGITSADAERS